MQSACPYTRESIGDYFRQTKIYDSDLPFIVQKDMAGFQVFVNNSSIVKRLQSNQDLNSNVFEEKLKVPAELENILVWLPLKLWLQKFVESN